MARPKDRADVGPEIRGALKRAFKILEERKKPLSTIWVSLFEDDPANAMRLAISLLPKEIQADVTTHTIEEFVTNAVIAQQNDSSADETQLH